MAAASDASITILRQKQLFAMPAIGHAIINHQLLDSILRAGVIVNDYLADIYIATAGLDTLSGSLAIGIVPSLTAGPLRTHMIGGGAGQ